jgi:hypothetical protein
LIKLSLTELGPDLWLVGFLSESLGTFEVVLLLEKNLGGLNVLSEFLVDAKSFIVKLILVLLGNLGELLTVIVIKSVDVVHDSALISLDGCQNQQVLKVSVVGESGVVENDSLEELDELVRELGSHESLDCAGDLISVLGFWKSCGNNLINDLLSVLVLWWENLTPESFVLSFNEIPSLHSVEEVSVGDFDEFIIALTPGSLVSGEGEVWVSFLTVFTDDL